MKNLSWSLSFECQSCMSLARSNSSAVQKLACACLYAFQICTSDWPWSLPTSRYFIGNRTNRSSVSRRISSSSSSGCRAPTAVTVLLSDVDGPASAVAARGDIAFGNELSAFIGLVRISTSTMDRRESYIGRWASMLSIWLMSPKLVACDTMDDVDAVRERSADRGRSGSGRTRWCGCGESTEVMVIAVERCLPWVSSVLVVENAVRDATWWMDAFGVKRNEM